ncbi:MAG: hypothetical protein RBS39_05845 [Phycisphaerales bacterium]|jgi:hypothetical protein|nr:hypothetical protein [Phycisphaerales bacterium]
MTPIPAHTTGTSRPYRVGWLFSLPRSGSSVAAYAAAEPFGGIVADEIFGPWDRTAPPYDYPPVQSDLVRAFKARPDDDKLSPEVVELAHAVFAKLAERCNPAPGQVPSIVCKHPHWVISPAQQKAAFPDQPSIHLARNPIHRVNSLVMRGWNEAIGTYYGYGQYRQLVERFENEPGVVYDDIRRDPESFFRAVYAAWGWDASAAQVRGAAEYARANYHANSKIKDANRSTDAVLSESKIMLPPNVIALYLQDKRIVAFMQRMGWSTDAADYPTTETQDAVLGVVPGPRTEPQHA